jgi:hypothetical protein
MTSLSPAGFALCTDNALYPSIRDWMCSFLDLTSAATDGALPRCDMLSVALGFETAPAKIGAVIDEPPAPKLCPKESDPAVQACDVDRDAGSP